VVTNDGGNLDTAGLPDSVQHRLLEMWQEPHRDYHGMSHLESGLAALDTLGGTQLEKIAFWCHDAVHTNTSPDDEHASVDIAEQLLWGNLTDSELDEVTRLILITINHRPDAQDAAGARVSDADLVGLALDWDAYEENIEGIRVELPELSGRAWRARRRKQVEGLVARPQLFFTDYGREHWEDRARVNLLRELDDLR
jgi:predicted metal-dependent HD superfamily phosphohydrolase